MKYQCWSCKQNTDIAGVMEVGTLFACDSCKEACVVNDYREEGNQDGVRLTVSVDQAYEGACESQEARRTEDQHYH